MYAGGVTPYDRYIQGDANVDNINVYNAITKGEPPAKHRPDAAARRDARRVKRKPSGSARVATMPTDLWEVVNGCWRKNASKRPTIQEVKKRFAGEDERK